MKKTFLLAVTAVVALMATSCQKEELGRVLTATIEQYEHNADSKAYINADNYACWENGDKVKINGTTHTISINDDAQTATITNTQGLSGDLLAFYPASMVSNLSATGGTVSLPHLQTYETTTDANGTVRQKINNPMAAYCPAEGSELKFRNLGALVKVTIQGSTSVRAIQVKGDDDQMLWGEAPLKLNNQNLPMLGKFSEGSNSVVLNFPRAVSIDGGRSFYIVVPAGSLFTNLTIAVLTTDGSTYTHHCKTSPMGQGLLRNQIGAVSYTPNGNEDDTFFPDWMIRYTGSSKVTPNSSSPFGEATIVNHTFSNGNGILLCDRPLTTIENGAFYECSNLASITLPASVTSIGSGAFAGCSSLTSITLPTNLTSIETSVFYGCTSLTSITLPTNLTSIGNNTFQFCSSLTSISLPAGVTSIGMFAFAGCGSLARVDCYATNPPELGTRVFDDIPSTAVLHVPTGKADTYSGSPWGTAFPGEGRIKGDL